MVDRNEEAARWFAASRRGVMLHEERVKYDAWRRDPENADRLAVLEAICSTWRRSRPPSNPSSRYSAMRRSAIAASSLPWSPSCR